MEQYAETRLQDIYNCLNSQGFQVFFPGQHVGDCIQEYVVVKPGVTTAYLEFSTNIAYYELLCYIPEDYPTRIEIFQNQIQKAMLELSPMIRFSNMVTSPYFDDSVKGWMIDLTYQNYRKVDSDVFQKTTKEE